MIVEGALDGVKLGGCGNTQLQSIPLPERASYPIEGVLEVYLDKGVALPSDQRTQSLTRQFQFGFTGNPDPARRGVADGDITGPQLDRDQLVWAGFHPPKHQHWPLAAMTFVQMLQKQRFSVESVFAEGTQEVGRGNRRARRGYATHPNGHIYFDTA
jgi:hypothetical protein